jgi:hypothetical protein
MVAQQKHLHAAARAWMHQKGLVLVMSQLLVVAEGGLNAWIEEAQNDPAWLAPWLPFVSRQPSSAVEAGLHHVRLRWFPADAQVAQQGPQEGFAWFPAALVQSR